MNLTKRTLSRVLLGLGAIALASACGANGLPSALSGLGLDAPALNPANREVMAVSPSILYSRDIQPLTSNPTCVGCHSGTALGTYAVDSKVSASKLRSMLMSYGAVTGQPLENFDAWVAAGRPQTEIITTPTPAPVPPAPAPTVAPQPVPPAPTPTVAPQPVPPAPAPTVAPEPIPPAPAPTMAPQPVPPAPAPTVAPKPPAPAPTVAPRPTRPGRGWPDRGGDDRDDDDRDDDDDSDDDGDHDGDND